MTMPSIALRPDQLSYLLERLTKDYNSLASAYCGQHGEAAKAEARQALSESVAAARQTVTHLQVTQNPELRPLLSKLTVQTELVDDVLKHPEYLRR
jgi:hypothetical protein